MEDLADLEAGETVRQGLSVYVDEHEECMGPQPRSSKRQHKPDDDEDAPAPGQSKRRLGVPLQRLENQPTLAAQAAQASKPTAEGPAAASFDATGPSRRSPTELEASHARGYDMPGEFAYLAASATSNMSLPFAPLASLPAAMAGTLSPNFEDPSRVSEYCDAILRYCFNLETFFRPRPDYMRKQRDINHNMRTILVDWLVEVADEYRLTRETLFIAVGYIDRFLSEMAVQRGKLQLVGVTCMLLAAKYEEIYPPSVEEFVYITDNTYSRSQVIKMEHVILKVLKFDMGACTALTFLDQFLVMANASQDVSFFAQYLAELSLQEGQHFLPFRPSSIAAAAVVLALHIFGHPFQPPALKRVLDSSIHDLSSCVEKLHAICLTAPTADQQAIRDKYRSSKFNRVSMVTSIPAPPRL